MATKKKKLLSHHTSKPLDHQVLNSADLVVTLCGDARDRCPVTPPGVRRLHWPLPDPAQATGSEEEVLAAFRRVREEIRRRVAGLLAEEAP